MAAVCLPLHLLILGTRYEIAACGHSGAGFSPKSVKTALQQVENPQGGLPGTPLQKQRKLGLGGALWCYGYFG